MCQMLKQQLRYYRDWWCDPSYQTHAQGPTSQSYHLRSLIWLIHCYPVALSLEVLPRTKPERGAESDPD